MSLSHRSWIPVLGLCGLVGCGGSTGIKTTKLDGGGTDSVGTKADGGAPDTGVAQPDVVPPDVGARADGSNADGDSALPDAGAADAADAGPDAAKPDIFKRPPDGGEAGPPDIGVDRPTADAAHDGTDGRASDVAVWDPDGGTRKDEIIRACAKAASCASQSNTYSASRCIQELGKTASRQDDIKIDRLLDCAGALPKASFCDGFTGCWGGDLFTLDPFVQGGQCDGNNLELRGASTYQYLDCSAVGGVCEEQATGVLSVACNARSCSGAEPVAPACAGTTASGCGGWAQYTSLDCAWSGRKCQIEGNYAVCVGTGASCSDSDKVTCAGSVATYCSGGARATVDCAKTGTATRCAAGAPSYEPCAAAGPECDPSSFAEYCDGNRLMVCADGSIVSVSCNDIGLVLCFKSSVGPAKCMPGV